VVTEVDKPGIRIVVAEDHPVVADGIMAVLARAKDMMVVGRARDGAEAIELLKQHQPDIVLLDLRMPIVDGIGVARWITRSGSNIRMVFLTIFGSDNDINRAIHAGAKAYLLKDTPAEEILNTIRRVQRGETAILRQRGQERAPKVNSAEFKPVEMEILKLIVQGHDNRTICSQLGLGANALKYLLRGLFSKLGVRKRAAAAKVAIERGLLDIN
jgi:two-component system, NarL family, response regulator